jgi:hypothetical protein
MVISDLRVVICGGKRYIGKIREQLISSVPITLDRAVEVIGIPTTTAANMPAMKIDFFPILPFSHPITIKLWPDAVVEQVDSQLTEFYAEAVHETGLLLG